MRKAVFVAAVIIMLLVGNMAQAGISIVKNGSFEKDGQIADITTKSPRYWCDVNLPGSHFLGWVSTDWSTHKSNSLTFYSGFGTFTAGETATVSQQVYLTDVNEIIFDIKLGTTTGDPWDPNERSAIMMIDNNDIVWDSNDLEPNATGEYFNQRAYINKRYNDANSHTLTLAMRANKSTTEWFYEYLARWDSVRFDTYCEGFGYLPEDLNGDCYVDINDLVLLAGQWLDPNENYDLFSDGIINFRDFAIFAGQWMESSYWQDDMLLASDLNDDGIVDFKDFAILSGDWAEQGSCIKGDIDGSEVVDYKDVFALAEEWLMRNWLYDL